MESGIYLQSYNRKYQQNPTPSSTFCFRKTFVQPPRRTQQRLIPLTPSTRKVMADFNASDSSINISEKPNYKSFSVSRVVRDEVQNILQELSISDQFISKEKIENIIETFLRAKVQIIHEHEESDIDLQQDMELINDKDIKQLIMENFQILEERTINLEERLNTLEHTDPKLSNEREKRSKININGKDEVLLRVETLDTNIEKGKEQNDKATVPLTKDTILTKTSPINIYDDNIYYARREYALNLLNYKKSKESLQLNEKSVLNPHVKPLPLGVTQLPDKLRRRPMFLTTN